MSTALVLSSSLPGCGDGGASPSDSSTPPDAAAPDGNTLLPDGGTSPSDASLDGNLNPLDAGKAEEVQSPVCPGYEVRLRLMPPARATKVLISDVATFDEASWQPLEQELNFRFLDTGFQTAFVVFGDDSGNVSPITTAGCLVDPQWEAATASEGGKPHRISEALPVQPTILALRIDAGRIVRENHVFPPLLDCVIAEYVEYIPIVETTFCGSCTEKEPTYGCRSGRHIKQIVAGLG